MSDHSATVDHKADSHGHDAAHGSMFAHVKVYLVIGFLLFFFTGVTVALSYFDFKKIGIFVWAFGLIGIHGEGINMAIGLGLATFKVCLVGAWFMHLKQEKAVIWRPLLFTFFFVSALFLLFLLAYADPIPGSLHWHH